MSIALVQHVLHTGGNGSTTISASTAGNLILVVGVISGSSLITDNQSNTYAQVPGFQNGDTGCWYLQNCPAGITSIIMGGSGGVNFSASEWSGVLQTGTVVDQVGKRTSSDETTPALTTTNAGDLIVGLIANGPAHAITAVSNGVGGGTWNSFDYDNTATSLPAYNIPGSTGTFSAVYTVTGGGTSDLAAIAFFPEPTGSPVTSTYSIELTLNKKATNANTTTGNSNTNFSVAFWMKVTGSTSQELISKWDNSIPLGWVITASSGFALFFDIFMDDTSFQRVQSPTDFFADNNWHQVVCTYSSSLGVIDMNMYVDGVFVANHNDPAPTSINYDNGKPIAMGQLGGFAVITRIDDARFYQSILTSFDAASLAMGFEIGTGTRQAYWPIEAGSGSIVADASGNGNTLTFNTAPVWSLDVPPQLSSGTTLTLSLFDSISSNDSMIDSFSIPLSDNVNSSDSFPQSFSVQSSFIAPNPIPSVETLTNQLVPAETKTFWKFQ